MIASEVEADTIHMIHSGLKLLDSIDKAPEQRTNIVLTPVLEYRSKINLEDNNKLTKVINNEHINTEKTIASNIDDGNDKKEDLSTNYMQSKTTGDKELEYTKSLEFKPGKRPEEAIQGNVIRFMYSPSSDPSAYWLQGTLNSRIDKLETAVKSGWRKNRFEVNKISIIKYWGDPKPLPTTIVVNLTNETAWALGTRIESCSRKECDHNVRIHLGYDAIKTMNLISDNGESEEPDGYSHMTRHKYEVKLLPPEEGLSSLFETRSPSTSKKEATNETRQELNFRRQSRRC